MRSPILHRPARQRAILLNQLCELGAERMEEAMARNATTETTLRKDSERMALFKRNKTWHTHFVVNGQRFRQSLATKDWREAQSKEKQLIAEASEGKLTHNSTALARLPFTQAADEHVSARTLELAPASQAKEKQLLVQLRAYF